MKYFSFMESEGFDTHQQGIEPREPREEWFGNARAPVDSGSDSKRNPTIPELEHPIVEPKNDYVQSLEGAPSRSDTRPKAPETPAPKPAVAGRFTGYIDSWENPIPHQDQPDFSTDGLQDAIKNFNNETQPDSDS